MQKERIGRYLGQFLPLVAYQEWIRDRCDGLGSAMAFRALLAIAPFTASLFIMAGALFGEEWTKAHFLPDALAWVGPRGGAVIEFLFVQKEHIDPEALFSLGVVGAIGFIVGASGFFGQLRKALETIWDVRRSEAGIRARLRHKIANFLYALVAGIMVFAGLALAALLSSVSPASPGLRKAAGELLAFLTFWGLGIFFFKTLPPVRLSWKQIVIWAGLISVFLLAGRSILFWRSGRPAPGSNVDVAQSLILVMLWLYYASSVFLYGAEMMRISLERSGAVARNQPPEQSPPLRMVK